MTISASLSALQPAWLDESAPGTSGFDPLGLAKDKASFQRFQEAEVFHGRWAMLGVAGSLGVELLGFGNWYDAPTAVSPGRSINQSRIVS